VGTFLRHSVESIQPSAHNMLFITTGEWRHLVTWLQMDICVLILLIIYSAMLKA